MTRRRDAGLALLVLAGTVLAAMMTTTQPAIEPFVAGVVGSVLLEAIALRNESQVEAAWRRPIVRTVAVACGVGLVVLAAVLAPAPWLNVAAGALTGYLALIVLAVIGVLDTDSNSS